MSLDPSAIGRDIGGQTLLVSRSRLQHFARATGQTDPVYVSVDAARAAGHPDLPVPPTFLFAIDLEGDSFGYLDDLGVDLRTILHGEQEFTYHRVCHAGDELSTKSTIADVYSKRGGLLDFLVRDTTVTDAAGAVVADLRSVVVVQNPVAEEVPA